MKRSLPIEKKPDEKELSKRSEYDEQHLIHLSAVLDRRPTKAQKLSKEQSDKVVTLRQRLKRDVIAYKENIVISGTYTDDNYQYRHVTLPKEIAAYLPDPNMNILLYEKEWRRFGIEVSPGWEHYLIYAPEPNIILLRRTHEVSRKVKLQQKELMAKQQQKEKEAAELAKEKGAPLPPPPLQPSSSSSSSDKGAPEAIRTRTTKTTSLVPERTSIRRKATTTTTTEDQPETNDQV